MSRLREDSNSGNSPFVGLVWFVAINSLSTTNWLRIEAYAVAGRQNKHLPQMRMASPGFEPYQYMAFNIDAGRFDI